MARARKANNLIPKVEVTVNAHWRTPPATDSHIFDNEEEADNWIAMAGLSNSDIVKKEIVWGTMKSVSQRCGLLYARRVTAWVKNE